MAATSTQEPFTPPSTFPPRNYYDVFLSFRGKDLRKNFIDHLYAALVRHGITTFRDDDGLKRGEDIGIDLLKSIEGSRVSVIVFSKNYADSRFCLEEVVKIMECKRTFQHMVVPVFYDVDPSEVRAQSGSFAEAFATNEERYKGRGMEGQLEKWRAALKEAADLSGLVLKNMANGHESRFIEEIVKDISRKLNLPCFDVAKYQVGMHSRVQQVNALLSLGSDNVRMIGIWGMGGSGKTTIAKAIYDQIRHKFEDSSFLANISAKSKSNPKPVNLVGLQEQLLLDITKTHNRTITNVDHGTKVIRQGLCHRRVLVVLDDVDSFHQLEVLAIRRDWFQLGSRIIVTTRDESLLKSLEVDEVYMQELLTYDESLQLFNWHAFRNKHPGEEYAELARKVVSYAGGSPLALEVLGSSLIGESMGYWRDTVERLEIIPLHDIQSKLRIGYDLLNDDQKDLFLDIACFFFGMDQNYVIEILEGCDFFTVHGLEVLSRRCLIRIELGLIMMHELLRDMGREIVRGQHRKEPGERSRLWSNDDSLDVLISGTGTKAVEGLILNLYGSDNVQVKTQAFAPMKRLRLLVLNYVRVSGSFEHLSRRLRWLCWSGFPLESVPSNLSMEKLVVIDMRYSNLKQVWKGMKILSKLKILNLSHSYCLSKTPDFSGVTNLKMLLLNDCTRLVKVHQSVECLDNLVALDLKNCKNLEELPLGVWRLTSLQYISLSGCTKLETLLGSKESPSNSSFSLFSSWALSIRNPVSINPGLLYRKILGPGEILSTLLARISHNFRLRCSCQCTMLQSLPEHAVNLKAVVARRYTSLERMSIGSYFRNSLSLTESGCHRLVEDNIARNYRKSHLQNQDLSAIGGFMILCPGDEVPDLFNYQSVGSVLSLIVPLLPDRKIRGLILCVVLTVSVDEMAAEEVESFHYPLLYQVKNKTKGLERRYQSAFNDMPGSLQEYTWLHYAPQHYLELQMEAGDEVEYLIIVTDHTEFQVKKCGVHLVYEENEKDYLSHDQAMIQYASPSYRNVILDKDISAYHGVADDKTVSHTDVRVALCRSVFL